MPAAPRTPPRVNETRKPTIKDVAARAGVAIGTVSRYLNQLPIRGASRHAVESAIRDLAYHKNHFAAAIKTNRSKLVAFLVPDFDEFHTVLMQRLMALLKKQGLLMLIYYHGGDRASFLDAARFFAEHRVDAVIATGSIPKGSQFEELQRDGVPVIAYNNRFETLKTDEVLVSNKQAVHKAISHFVEMGHKRIAIVTGEMHHDTATQRLLGYQAALAEHGIAPVPQYVLGGSWTQAEGFAALQTLMALPEPPTAVFFSSYVIALGGLAYVREYAVAIPEQLSVISFDDVLAFQLFQPPITAIVQPIDDMADSIVSLLSARLQQGASARPRSVVLPCTLVLRRSVKRVASP
jgi:LacI family transcriptional regulator